MLLILRTHCHATAAMQQFKQAGRGPGQIRGGELIGRLRQHHGIHAIDVETILSRACLPCDGQLLLLRDHVFQQSGERSAAGLHEDRHRDA